MKLIIKSIIFFITISITINTYAIGSCEIEKSTPDFIINYKENNIKILKNIQNTVKGYPNYRDIRAVEDFIKAGNQTISIFNEMFNFTGYYSYFNYYVTFPISNEVPYPVRRDYEILKNNNESLIQYLSYLDKNMYTEVIVENACNGIENCDFKDLKAKEILKSLIQNSDNILDLYRLNVIGETEKYSPKEIILTEQDFEKKVSIYYSTESINNCSKKEGGFFEIIQNRIENIKFLNKDAIGAKQKWIDAWKLLIGEKPDLERETERSELKKYLSSQGISTESQDIMLQNLENFNNQGFSENNNFIANTIKQVESEIRKETENFKKYYIEDFLNEDQKVIGINNYRLKKNSAEKSLEIKEKISRLYETEKPFAAIGNNHDSLLRGKILETHINLSEAIETLEKNCKLAVKLCNRQGGGGNCGKCN